jgi:exosortase/archaeosortase family protein
LSKKNINWPFLEKNELSFLAKFLAIFFALFYILKLLDLGFLLRLIANVEFALIKLFGIQATLKNEFIILGPPSSIQIVAECSGLVMIILLAALLWSTEMKNRKRFEALLIFSPLLFLFNIFRLLITILALAVLPNLFEIIHIILWFIDSAVVMYIWMHVQGIKLSDFSKVKMT